jgi:hypothetical protein
MRNPLSYERLLACIEPLPEKDRKYVLLFLTNADRKARLAAEKCEAAEDEYRRLTGPARMELENHLRRWEVLRKKRNAMLNGLKLPPAEGLGIEEAALAAVAGVQRPPHQREQVVELPAGGADAEPDPARDFQQYFLGAGLDLPFRPRQADVEFLGGEPVVDPPVDEQAHDAGVDVEPDGVHPPSVSNCRAVSPPLYSAWARTS